MMFSPTRIFSHSFAVLGAMPPASVACRIFQGLEIPKLRRLCREMFSICAKKARCVEGEGPTQRVFFGFLCLRIVLLFLRFLVLPEGSFDGSFDDEIADGGVDRHTGGEEEKGDEIIHSGALLCLPCER